MRLHDTKRVPLESEDCSPVLQEVKAVKRNQEGE